VGSIGGTPVIGPKKLSTIRQELRRALAETGDDAIRWLEERMLTPEHHEPAASGESEVLHSLHRIVAATAGARRKAGAKRKAQRLGTKT
jgi:hypothetical protein